MQLGPAKKKDWIAKVCRKHGAELRNAGVQMNLLNPHKKSV